MKRQIQVTMHEYEQAKLDYIRVMEKRSLSSVCAEFIKKGLDDWFFEKMRKLALSGDGKKATDLQNVFERIREEYSKREDF